MGIILKRTWIFIAITFLLSWGIAFILQSFGGLEESTSQVWIFFIMVMPAAGNVLTRLFTKDGETPMYFRPEAEGGQLAKMILLAWLGPIAAIIFGAALYFIVHPSMFDFKMTYYVETYQAMCAEEGVEYSLSTIRQAVWVQIASGIIFYPLLNILPCIGCELGFRAYLMPQFAKQYNVPTAALLSGIIWGLWYVPLVGMGQFYGTSYAGYPYLGMAACILMCMVLGVSLSWLQLETKSCLFPALALSGFNSFSTISVFFCTSQSYSPFIGPVATGVIGGFGFIILAALSMMKLREMKIS